MTQTKTAAPKAAVAILHVRGDQITTTLVPTPTRP